MFLELSTAPSQAVERSLVSRRWPKTFNRMISRAWRIATLSAGIDRSLGLPKKRP
jgi:hypothetical protein